MKMSDIVNEAVGSIYDKGDPEMAELGRRLQKVAITVKDPDRANMIAITGAEMIKSDGDENKLLDKLMANGISPKQYEIWKEKAKTLPPFSASDVPDTGSSDDTVPSDDASPRDDDDAKIARQADKFAKLKTKG